jgi:imidazolonepropionase-like amidohydrolase
MIGIFLFGPFVLRILSYQQFNTSSFAKSFMFNNAVRIILSVITLTALFVSIALPQAVKQQVTSGKRYNRIVIRNAIVIDGNGTPASGPKDIVIVGDKISEIVSLDPVTVKSGEAKRPAAGDAEIDAAGKYVLPGLINIHAHTQDERGGVPMPVEYCMKMWLACGITTVRDVLSSRKTLDWREKSAKNELASPRIFAYGVFPGASTPDEARAKVRELKQAGFDGIKLFAVDRDIMEALEDEAHKLGMLVAHHVGVAETNAWDDIKFGTRSIEHWYGIPDAAIESGRQDFPSGYNYNDETDRFRYAGRLWREANWARRHDRSARRMESDLRYL